MKKAVLLVIIILVLFIFFVGEGQRVTLNPDGTRDHSKSLTDYFSRGIRKNMENMTSKNTTALMQISNFCFRTIVK